MIKRVLRAIAWTTGICVGLSIVLVIVFRWLPVYYTPLMILRGIEALSAGESFKIHHQWVQLEEMSPYLPVAVMASEDQKFMTHQGFDFEAIESAARHNASGGQVRGASTISQQTAKNVFLLPSRTWLRKGLEAYFTVLIELFWSKERIMEVYLNSIEMGPNIYGAEAVAKLHFGCRARDLHRGDCALIAATLPNPLRYSSLRPTSHVRKRQRQILRQMRFFPITGEDALLPNSATSRKRRNESD